MTAFKLNKAINDLLAGTRWHVYAHTYLPETIFQLVHDESGAEGVFDHGEMEALYRVLTAVRDDMRAVRSDPATVADHVHHLAPSDE